MSVKTEEASQLPHGQLPQPENLDILDEFLDRRLYDDSAFSKQQQVSPQQQQHQQTPQQLPDINTANGGDDEMFSTFLTDKINENEYLMFSSNALDSHMLGVDDFHIPEATMSVTQGAGAAQTSMAVQQQSQYPPPAQQSQQSQMGSSHTTPRSVLSPPQQEIFTTPTGTYPAQQRSHSNNYDMHAPPVDPAYESARRILSQLKFGRESPAQFDAEFPRDLVDIDESTLPYQLRVDNLPQYSRVETQIKLKLSVSPPPPQLLVHLPADTIAKQKQCLSGELGPVAKENMLFLDAFVITNAGDKQCNICSRCVRREQKRASRRKSGVSDNLNWMTNANKRAIIFNCKEVISFPPIPTYHSARSVEISSRIVCYCRHHNEPKGFKLLVTMRNGNGELVAKHVSSPIMIMDRKKNNEDGTTGVNTASNSANEVSATTVSQSVTQPISPASFEDDSSEPHTSDSRVFKRKRTWSPELSDGFNIAPSRKPSGSSKRDPISPQSQISSMDQNQIQIQQPGRPSVLPPMPQVPIPVIQRVIPSQGPLRGGIEVTLLGSNFKQGLGVKFGINKALSTQCWSDSTMVTYLPPSSQPGQVVVSIEDPQNANLPSGSAVFTYLDDTDRQMIELALQIVGLKMNGKLEDARNIARKIIGSDGNGSQESSASGLLPDGATSMSATAVTDEDLVLKVINRLPNRPNWALCTTEGQTLLHLSALKGYSRLVSSLLQKGARVDYRDAQGYTPLHYASLTGDRKSIEMLISCKAKVDAKTDDGLTPEDVADSNVLDMFRCHSSAMSRKLSNSSFSSSIFSLSNEDDVEIPGGLHVSRMTVDHLTDETETDAYDSDSSAEASNEESEDDWIDDREESLDETRDIVVSDTLNAPQTGTSITEGSLWNKVRNVFTNSSDQEQLPKYDELFPLSAKQFSLPKLRFPTALTSSDADVGTSSAQAEAASSSDEGEDVFQKFFNQRKNVQNDKMLLFFWLPLLIMIVSWFILSNAGYTAGYADKFQELVRSGLGTIMLGNERVKVALNRHFSQVNEAMTSVINAS